MLIFRLVEIGNQAEGDTTACCRETALLTLAHGQALQLLSRTSPRATRIVPQLGASAAGICQMLMRHMDN